MRKLTVAIALVLVLAVAAPAVQAQMEDVDEDHWAYEAVEQLVAAGVVEGYPDGEFKGEQTMTRYEMAMMVGRALDNINEDIAALEADVADLEDGLTAAQAADVTEIVQEMIAEEMPAADEGLTEQQAEEVTEIVAALTAEFEEELDEMEAEIGALEYTLETETDALWAETEGIYETLDSLEARVEELEEEDEQYEGALTMELDTIVQRLSPETTSQGTDFTLTFDHTHYITDGFEAYVEWTPDSTDHTGFAEGDVLDLTFSEELHGIPGVQFRAFHDSIESYGAQVLDLHRDAHLEATLDAADELDVSLGLDVDYVFQNELDDGLHDEQYGRMAHLGLEGSVDIVDYGVDVVDGEGAEDSSEFLLDEDEYDFLAYEVNVGVEDVVENFDFDVAYYAYDDEHDGDYDEDYDGFEANLAYDIEDTRFDVGLGYANVEAGFWAFSDETPTDHPYGALQDGYVDGDGAEKIYGELGVEDIAGFDHTFLVEYWDTDGDVSPTGDSTDDMLLEWFAERDIGEDTVLEMTLWSYQYDEDILDDEGEFDLAAAPNAEEDSVIDFELYLEHELYSW
ncbi:S-layer homology domain-containing protein [Halarsenatibacter silvermanii]|uniref:S-layer homology domain-containing protein n=1 Tax=Halarsenatibacter silvermanii TaxID=321763 RepID=A0A1G9HRY4_9FIRM|nr:S-layer homology domain-containing protein [Halarsenatibacter silvermanii]SDL15622.1 S-layer homology domain-containing protein [Halarsenatibacter silvermanii]